MLTIKSVVVDDAGSVKLQVRVSNAEDLSVNGRVVRAEFGTVSAMNWTKADLQEGLNTVKLQIMRWEELLPGNYSLFFNTTFNSDNEPLSDEGPYDFIKETNE